jgi:hypothetical protein
MMQSAFANQEPIRGIQLSVQPPGPTDSSSLKEVIGDAFPSWHLVLNLEGQDPFKTGTKQKIYVWIGVLMTTGIAMISLLLAGYLRRKVSTCPLLC